VTPVLAGVVFSTYLIIHAWQANRGIHCFPLDDPWIHLTYARNIAQHHSFSYFPGDGSTGGSTSPLYTLLLALGFHVTKNEKLLSYVLGIVFQAAFLAMAALWGRRRFGDAVWAAALVLVLALDPRIAILSVSGMETSLFLFLVAAAFWAYAEARAVLLGVSLGLGVWTRPDMLILAGVFGLAALATRWRPARDRAAVTEHAPPLARAAVVRAAIPFAALVLLYLAFNYLVSGEFFPNTMQAKHALYQDSKRHFITHGFRDAVLASSFWILTPLAAAAIAVELWRWVRRRRVERLAECGWAMGLLLAYVLFVPFAHRFSRYLVPVLPAIAVLALALIHDLSNRSAWRSPRGAIMAAVLVAVVGTGLVQIPGTAEDYRYWCAYHYRRHERCGRWIHEHTAPTAVVATHDVGAIAYYSERRVIDTVGLIQRDAIPYLNQPGYIDFLNEFLARENVTHVALLDSWMHYAGMQIANENALWVADPNPEILTVYERVPGWTVVVPEGIPDLNRRAGAMIKAGRAREALDLLTRSLQASPHDPATWYLMGVLKSAAGERDVARKAYQRALELYPEFENARYSLGFQLARDGQREEALAVLAPLHQRNPEFPGLRELWQSLQPRQ
jgi:tetratricopeptide (TPR) repeat protein